MLIVHHELSKFERRGGILVRPEDRVESGSSVLGVLAVVLVTAARCAFVLLGGSTHVQSTEQHSREEHVQARPGRTPRVFVRRVQI